jgi:hypothetical protein
MSERSGELILPQGRVEEGIYPNGDHYWVGKFSDGSACSTVSEPYHDQNYVDYRDPSGDRVHPPRQRDQLTKRDLIVAMYAAARLNMAEDPF